MKSDFTVSGISVIIFIENETFQDVARNDIEFLRWGSQIFPALPTIAATTKDGTQDAYFSPVIKRTRNSNKRVRGEEYKSLSAAIKRTKIAQTNEKKIFQQEYASVVSK